VGLPSNREFEVGLPSNREFEVYGGIIEFKVSNTISILQLLNI
jgi:hypothetical protein